MYRDQSELIWLVPLVFAGVMALVAARQWWRVAHGKEVAGNRIKATDGDRYFAAAASAYAFGSLGVAILALLAIRFQ